MVVFFKKGATLITAVDTDHKLTDVDKEKLSWLFDGAKPLASTSVKGRFIGPRKEMITPWSTNAVEITQNMGLKGINRIEQFILTREESPRYDKMLQRLYDGLNSSVFKVDRKPEPIVYIDDITTYNQQEGLALSPDEEEYLRQLAKKIGPSSY